MNKKSKIYIAGHTGLVGSAILNSLLAKGYCNLIYRTHEELDLKDQSAVKEFFSSERPEYVFLAAAKVGGILANNQLRADFIYENMMIQNNVIHNCYFYSVKKLLFLGSSCIYPKRSPQPIKESALLQSYLEYTNEPYAIAKISGIKMCESYNLQYGTNFISVMPSNLYGPNDNFDLKKSHVLPALLRKIHLSKCLKEENWELIKLDLEKHPIDNVSGANTRLEILSTLNNNGIKKEEVEIWGSGKPRREFLWSEDMADACVFIFENIEFNMLFDNKDKQIKNTHINIGYGSDISITELAHIIGDIVDYTGIFNYNTCMPDGVISKLIDASRLNSFGWKRKTSLEDGIKKLYNLYLCSLQ